MIHRDQFSFDGGGSSRIQPRQKLTGKQYRLQKSKESATTSPFYIPVNCYSGDVTALLIVTIMNGSFCSIR